MAPYATALATMVDPRAAIENFARLEALGALGTYGFYESIDFTPTRMPEGARHVVVRAWMAHHQGMSIVALANAVFDGRMRARFHEDPWSGRPSCCWKSARRGRSRSLIRVPRRCRSRRG